MKNFEARTHGESKTFYHLVKVGPGGAGVSEGPTAGRVLPQNPQTTQEHGVSGPLISPAHFTDGAGRLRTESVTAGGPQAGGGGRLTWARLLALVVPRAILLRRGGCEPVAVRLPAARWLPTAHTGKLGGADCWGPGSSWALLWAPQGCVPGAPLSLGKGRAPGPVSKPTCRRAWTTVGPAAPQPSPSGTGLEQEPDRGPAHAAHPHAHARALQPQPPAQRPRRRAPPDDLGGPRRQAGAGGRQGLEGTAALQRTW